MCFHLNSSTVFTATDLICRQSIRLSKIPKETIVICEKNKQAQPAITTEIIRVGIDEIIEENCLSSFH